METTEQPAGNADKFDIEKARELLLAGNPPDLVAAELGIKPSTFRYQLREVYNLVPNKRTVWELVPWRTNNAEQSV